MLPLRQWTTEPSAVALLYRIETCAGDTVRLVPQGTQPLSALYTLSENNSALSSEAAPSISLSAGQRVYVSLLMDFSLSTQPVKAELVASARLFTQTLLERSPKVFVDLRIFDGRPQPHTVLLPTRNLVLINEKLEALSTATPGSAILGPTPDSASTNLYQAFVSGVEDLQARERAVMSANAGGVVTSGFLVVFTDGADTANRVPRSSAVSAVAAGRAANGTGAGMTADNVQTYAVALAGSDFTADARAALLETLGSPRYFLAGDVTQLSARFTTLANTIADQSEATHLLTYCSPARAGERTVSLSVAPLVGGTAAGSSGLSFSFSAAGFAGGCIEFFQTVCGGKACAGFNCGACDDATESCNAQQGTCINNCALQGLCSGIAQNDLGYQQMCSADSCVAPDGGPVTTDAGMVQPVDSGIPVPPPPENWALLTYVWGKMTTEAGSVKGVLMAVGVAKLEEETHG